MIIVSNTTPLSELAKVGQLNLLQKLFGKIIIPQEVYNEVTTGNHRAAAENLFDQKLYKAYDVSISWLLSPCQIGMLK